MATDPGPSPELGKADTRSGEGPGSVACDTPQLSEFSSMPENLHGACNVDAVRSHDPLRTGRERQFRCSVARSRCTGKSSTLS